MQQGVAVFSTLYFELVEGNTLEKTVNPDKEANAKTKVDKLFEGMHIQWGP